VSSVNFGLSGPFDLTLLSLPVTDINKGDNSCFCGEMRSGLRITANSFVTQFVLFLFVGALTVGV